MLNRHIDYKPRELLQYLKDTGKSFDELSEEEKKPFEILLDEPFLKYSLPMGIEEPCAVCEKMTYYKDRIHEVYTCSLSCMEELDRRYGV